MNELVQSMADQLPLYSQELLNWGRFTNTIGLYVCIFLTLFLWIAAAFLWRVSRAGIDRDFIWLIALMLTGITGLGIAGTAKNLCKIQNAPRVYILDKTAKKLMK